MSATAGNAQPGKMYNFNAMGDGEVASFIGGDIMHRANSHCISLLGPMHGRPEVDMGVAKPLGLGRSGRGKGSY